MITAIIIALACAQGDRTNPASKSPFQPEEALRRALGETGPRAAASVGSDDISALGAARLRALVKMSSKSTPAAIIEVAGLGSYTLREGDRFFLSRVTRARAAIPGSAGNEAPRHDASASAAAAASSPSFPRGNIAVPIMVESISVDGVRLRVDASGDTVTIR
jgi:hypothetical protein